jgi:hypothetical protein
VTMPPIQTTLPPASAPTPIHVVPQQGGEPHEVHIDMSGAKAPAPPAAPPAPKK